MRKLFYSGLAGLALFEVLKVYLIMPLPGSQRFESLDTAYFLHTHRWFFRIPLLLMIAAGGVSAFHAERKRWPVAAALATIAVAWVFNFQMTAERMFKQPRTLAFKRKAENQLDENATGDRRGTRRRSQSLSDSLSRLSSPGARHDWWKARDGYVLQCLPDRARV
jgi:hypothetical protein